MKRKFLIVLAMVLVLCGAFAMSAQAYPPYLDFNVFLPANGTVSYNPATNSLLVGENIGVGSVSGVDTPLNAGTQLTILDGHIDFETGPFTGAVGNELDFSAGSSSFINIHGTITGVSTTDALVLGSPLKDSPTPHVVVDANLFGGRVVFDFVDVKDPGLLAFYGLTDKTPVGGSINLSFSTSTQIDITGVQGFTSDTIASGDVRNTFVPVPPSLVLLGSGLLGLVGLRFRRSRA